MIARRPFLAGLAGALSGTLALPQVAQAREVVSASEMAKPQEPVQDARGLVMTGAEGQPLQFADFPADLLVVNFWGPWCPPCRREMPSLSRLARRLEGTSIRVLPVAFDRLGVVRVRRFFDQMSIDNLPVIMGDGQNLFDTLGLEYLPVTAIIDPEGQHIATVQGEAVWDDEATLDWLASPAG